MEKNSVYERVCRCLIAYDSIRAAFSAFDVNGDGDLEPREFLFVLAKVMITDHFPPYLLVSPYLLVASSEL